MGSRMAIIYIKKILIGNFYYVGNSIINKFIDDFKYKKIQH